MNEIEKMYENAGVKADRIVCYRGFDSCIDNDFNCHCHNEKPCKDAAKIYPPFTAEKQLELICFLLNANIKIDICKEPNMKMEICDIAEALAEVTNTIWQDLTEEEKQQVKGILE